MTLYKTKAKSRAKAEDLNWVIAHHAQLNGFHEQLVGDGFAFCPGKVRVWRCKDGTVSIRLVYEKKRREGTARADREIKQKQPDYKEEQAVLLRLRGSGQQAFVETRELSLSWAGRVTGIMRRGGAKPRQGMKE